jgi:hypothetical protein
VVAGVMELAGESQRFKPSCSRAQVIPPRARSPGAALLDYIIQFVGFARMLPSRPEGYNSFLWIRRVVVGTKVAFGSSLVPSAARGPTGSATPQQRGIAPRSWAIC